MKKIQIQYQSLMLIKPLLAAFLLSGLILYSQEIPPIQKYKSQETGSGNQNWMISQGLELGEQFGC